MSVLSRDPIRRRQELAARRIRGVGAAERADGHAWSRLSSWQKEGYGSQRNFRSAMDASAEHRAAAEAEETGRQKAREDAEHQAEVWNRARYGAAGGSMTPPTPPVQTEEQKRREAQDTAAKTMQPKAMPKDWQGQTTAQRSQYLRGVNQAQSAERAAAARAKYGQPMADNSIRPGASTASATKPRQYKDWLAARRRAPMTFRA